jgi:copper chaperone CopZ
MKYFSFLLILFVFLAACNNTATSDQKNTDNTEESTPQEGVIEIAIIDITGMHCESCEKSITDLLLEIDGVVDAKASLEHEQAKAKFEPAKVSADELKAAIIEKGYGVDNVEIIEMEPQDGGTTE